MHACFLLSVLLIFKKILVPAKHVFTLKKLDFFFNHTVMNKLFRPKPEGLEGGLWPDRHSLVTSRSMELDEHLL